MKDSELYDEDLKLVAQIVQAEAGNQDYKGKRLVACVVWNRLESDKFPDTILEVIFQNDQFSPIKDGGWDKAAQNISEDCYSAAKEEFLHRSDYNILYFGRGKTKYAKNHYKHGDHWFSY